MTADDLRALAEDMAAVEHPDAAPASYINGWLACVDAVRAKAQEMDDAGKEAT